MNANSQPKAPTTINNWLEIAGSKLEKAKIPSARLDSLILLEHALGYDKSWILAHNEQNLSAKNAKLLDELLKKRLNGVPIAYILGWKEFYGRRFKVNKDVLIPRPETEGIIELVKRLGLPNGTTAVDIGTGSGCIAVTLKLEYPEWLVHATDISEPALKIARQNARELGAEVTFCISDLIQHPTSNVYRLIIANLPYVDASWQTKGTDYEPDLALYAKDGGLSLIKILVKQAGRKQNSGNWLVLESDPRQHDSIIRFARGHGYSWSYSEGYATAFQKI